MRHGERDSSAHCHSLISGSAAGRYPTVFQRKPDASASRLIQPIPILSCDRPLAFRLRLLFRRSTGIACVDFYDKPLTKFDCVLETPSAFAPGRRYE